MSVSTSPATTSQTYNFWRVLIVDDQPDNLDMATAVFELRGVEVKAVDNARDALRILDEFQPTVILLDLAMPDMTGWEMVKLIRERERDSHTPVIALSVRLSITDGDRAKEAGFDGFIAKPFSIHSIFHEIETIVDQIES
jgi:CheY-like chemotaxis protein